MEYRVLGRTGVRVSPLCLGGMMFGAWGSGPAESRTIINAALDAGINIIDTADVYSAGESESIIGAALAGRRDEVVLATKVNGRMGPGVNDGGNSRRWILRACEASLRRLGTDHIDLYQVHRPDDTCAPEETFSALADLVEQGKVRYVGTSTFPASAIVENLWLHEQRRVARVVCEQPPYSLLSRGVEADVLPTCRRHGLGVLAWAPLSGGWLSGRWRAGAPATSSRLERVPARYDVSLPHNQRKLAAVERLAQLAESVDLTLIQLAVAFVINHPAVTAAIVGPRTLDHLTGYLTAADVRLDDATLDRVDEIVTPGTDFSWSDVLAPPSISDASTRRR